MFIEEYTCKILQNTNSIYVPRNGLAYCKIAAFLWEIPTVKLALGFPREFEKYYSGYKTIAANGVHPSRLSPPRSRSDLFV